jgi:Cu-processing system permease protein
VLIYDMALLGLLVVDKGETVSAGMLDILLLLNPADAFRVLNLTSSASISQFAGMAGLSKTVGLSPSVLLGALGLWIALPLAGAALLLGRRQL